MLIRGLFIPLFNDSGENNSPNYLFFFNGGYQALNTQPLFEGHVIVIEITWMLDHVAFI